MSDEQDKKPSGTLSLGGNRGKLTVNKPVGAEVVKQSFSHGRSKSVAVEVRKVRGAEKEPAKETVAPVAATPAATAPKPAAATATPSMPKAGTTRTLSEAEREARLRALKTAGESIQEAPERVARPITPQVVNFGPTKTAAPAGASGAPNSVPAGTSTNARPTREELRARELEELKKIQGQERQQAEAAEARRQQDVARRPNTFSGSSGNTGTSSGPAGVRQSGSLRGSGPMTSSNPRGTGTDAQAAVARRAGDNAAAKLPTRTTAEEEEARNNRYNRRAGAPARPGGDANQWRGGRVTMEQAMDSDGNVGRSRSVAAMRRRAEKFARKAQGQQQQEKVTRDVIIPEAITVGELANRMSERAADVVKTLMKMGMMVTITQTIDADTAELVVTEFGHRFQRVAESDVETGLGGIIADAPESLLPRPPVVTIMGHVDHGKTSLLDALRKTNVVAKEAGGITQHIGAYQITLPKGPHAGQKITFIDTPGHAAFTEMRARGANVTDVVILVVAANDGIMPQTVEALKHAQAAEVPLVVAINKIDLPGANPGRVREALLQHNIQVEEMGGTTLAVEVSAKTGHGLEKLLEAVLLQAEILDLKANPNRVAEGKIIESKLDKGRGAVTTVLVQRGTLRVGDIFVAGSEWGRVRALVNDLGEQIKEAGPAMPVEVLGSQGVPNAGDEFIVAESEAKAREVADFRARRKRTLAAAAAGRGTMEQMLAASTSGIKNLTVIVKGDVHGSIEAIKGSLEKLTAENSEVKVKVLDASVGAISEADINLAKASGGVIIGFNVRANPMARDMAKRDGVEIRYYSVIYEIIDEVKALLGGLLSPVVKQNFIGYAEILQVFNITKVGKIAGCKITEGIVKRGAGVRLLRDGVVIHEGKLKTLKRMKDEVKEVREGFECGMAFENYENIQVGDLIECFETTEEARTLEQ